MSTPAAPVIEYAELDAFALDALNPRLGRRFAQGSTSQPDVLDIMRDWTLEELAVSFLENGFWPQEALVVVREKVAGKEKLVAVEGNRRLAALTLLFNARKGVEQSQKWRELAAGATGERLERLKRIPYIEKNTRAEVRAYLGFRHVTGIKEWKPAEKAQFIASLIEQDGLSYDQVRKRIGSKTPTVRQNYISFKLLLQMEGTESIAVAQVESRFSVLYLSLRTEGVRTYLHVDIEAPPDKARKPVPAKHVENLTRFARWLFGDEKNPPVVPESRHVDEFGRVLMSTVAVQYLERTDRPSFEVARRLAGIAEDEVAEFIERAADQVEQSLSVVHHHVKAIRVRNGVERLAIDVKQLTDLFPQIRKRVLGK